MRDDPSDSAYAPLAARALAAAKPATIPPPLGDRAEAIAAIEQALRARAGRRWRPWRVAVPAAAIAAAAAVLLVITMARPGGREQSGGQQSLQGTPADLRAGTEMRGPATIELRTGTRLRLDAETVASVVELGAIQKFRLDQGRLHAEVAKLIAGRRFLIATPDAEIEVKGTRFDVDLAPTASACGPRTRTRVAVQEGVVTVRFGGDEISLSAGAVWPDCVTPPSAGPQPTTEPARSAGAAEPVKVARPRGTAQAMVEPGPRVRRTRRTTARTAAAVMTPPSPATTAPSTASTSTPSNVAASPNTSSTLADQNDLLAAALAARHRGDAAEALRWLDQLLSRYPQGQLVDSARAERRRLLRKGPSEGPLNPPRYGAGEPSSPAPTRLLNDSALPERAPP